MTIRGCQCFAAGQRQLRGSRTNDRFLAHPQKNNGKTNRKLATRKRSTDRK